MHIRKDDIVKIFAGKDSGKSGKVMAVNKKSGRVTIEGINVLARHQRPKKSGEKGQTLRLPMPVSVSNVVLLCPHCKKPTRINSRTDEKGIKSRICKKCSKKI